MNNFSIVRNGSVTTAIPRYTITCDITDSRDGAFLRSYRTNFPNILLNLTNNQLNELFEDFIKKAILLKVRDNVD